MTPEIASSLGIKDAKGALVAEVVPDGPAAKAGFEQGDIVTAINGQAVEDNRDLTRKVALVPSGQTATFTDQCARARCKILKAEIGNASRRQGRVQRAQCRRRVPPPPATPWAWGWRR